MAKKTLQIIETAYRGTIEEQDDTTVWFTHAMKGAGADVAVLLRGNAVNYAVTAQDASGLSFGGKAQTQPPRLASDLSSLVSKGVRVLAVDEDLSDRGIARDTLIGGIEFVSRAGLPRLLGEFEQVWHW